MIDDASTRNRNDHVFHDNSTDRSQFNIFRSTAHIPRALRSIFIISWFFSLIFLPFYWSSTVPSRPWPEYGNVRDLSTIHNNLSTINAKHVHQYLDSLLLPIYNGNLPPRMRCEMIDIQRYAPLGKTNLSVLLTGNMYNEDDILPTQLHALIDLILSLPHITWGISAYESGTPLHRPTSVIVREVIPLIFERLGVPRDRIFTTTNSTRPSMKGVKTRIQSLANVRNHAVSPLFSRSSKTHYDLSLFFNDVYFCPRDMMELLLHHTQQKAHVTCGIDWKDKQRFYDLWVARDISGDLFSPTVYEVEQEWSWGQWPSSKGEQLFRNHPPSRIRYESKLPVQCYVCWNGILVMDAKPFYDGGVRFRSPKSEEGECDEGEASRIIKDFWAAGYNRVQVLPSVNFAYQLGLAEYVRGKNEPERKYDERLLSPNVEWQPAPEKSRCIGGNYDFGSNDWRKTHL